MDRPQQGSRARKDQAVRKASTRKAGLTVALTVLLGAAVMLPSMIALAFSLFAAGAQLLN